MKQQQFENTHQRLWQRFEQLLENPNAQDDYDVTYDKIDDYSHYYNQEHQSDLTNESLNEPLNDSEANNKQLNNKQLNNSGFALPTDLTSNKDLNYEFIRLYRIICQHYALAKQRHYSPQLVHFLHELVVIGHRQLYQRKSHIWTRIYHFYAYTFPVRLRVHANLFWLSLMFFIIPAVLMGWACYEQSDMLYSIMSQGQVNSMEEMYNPDNDLVGRNSERRSDTDIAMFGYYVKNNVGIDFQIYGMGIFAGIGTILSLVYNGLVLGGVAGHLSGIGYGENFWAFVAGHGSFELTAAVISGAAGLRLAQSLFMPGNYPRLEAFKIAGKQSIDLLIGAASMTFIAAFIEAFWSSSALVSDLFKYGVAVAFWILVIGYLLYCGSSSHALRATQNMDDH